jgi:hypothetical protein
MKAYYPTIVDEKLYGAMENVYVTEIFMQYYSQRWIYVNEPKLQTPRQRMRWLISPADTEVVLAT